MASTTSFTGGPPSSGIPARRHPGTSRAPRGEPVELLAVARAVRARQPAELHPGAARGVRRQPHPEPAAPHRQRQHQPDQHEDRRHEHPHLRGIVADLQRHPVAHAVEADAGAVVQRDLVAGPHVLPRHPRQLAGVELAPVDREDRLAAPVVQPEVAAQHVDGHLGVVQRREHRGHDLAARAGGREQAGDRELAGAALLLVRHARAGELRGALRQQRGLVDRPPLDLARPLLAVRDR